MVGRQQEMIMDIALDLPARRAQAKAGAGG